MEKNPNKFKLVVMGVFIFFILVGLVAFSTFKSSSSTSSSVVVSVWGTMAKDVFDNYIIKFKQDKTLQFNLIYTYKSPDNIDAQLVEAIATGKAPDAILIPQTLEKRYLDKVLLITSIPQRTFLDTFVQEAELYIQPSGGIFALPFFVDPMIMYWNRDMFTNANIATPPTKWSSFPNLAARISRSDSSSNITKSLASLGEFKNVDNAKALLSTLILQAGSPIVSFENGLFGSRLDNKSPTDIMTPAVSALQFYTDYSNPKKSVYSWNRSLPSSKSFFLSGDLAIYFGFASEYQDIKDKNPNLNFDVAVMPQILDATAKTTFGELYGFAILKSSPNATPTFGLLSLLVGTDSVNSLVQLMNVAPARRDVISAGTPNSVKTVFYNSSLISRGWIDPDSKATDQIFQNMVENVTTGRTSVQDAVTKASQEINNLLQ